MPATVIVGAQWGDEGKGKVVDLLAESADVVVRYAGGPNAGHTLVVGGRKVVLRLVPSGALHPHTLCLLGHGMVIDPATLLEELDALEELGVTLAGRLQLSRQAHLILPYHVELDVLRERGAGATAIGTTKRGIGPAYEDKVGRRGLRAGDLEHPTRLRAKLSESLEHWRPSLSALGGRAPDLDAIYERLLALAPRIVPLLDDISHSLDVALREGKRAMLEGAQGTMLDIDCGTYPFVTSSSAVAGGACTGAGIGPSRIDRVIGITKAYTTRVGGGPFPTELHDARGEHLRTVGHEFGSVTGRPRRTGWLDLAALRYARRVNGLDGLAVTKLDVLTGLDRLLVCTGYRTPDGIATELTPDLTEAATPLEPVHVELTTWDEPLATARDLADLPTAARRYLSFIEETTDISVDLVSVGPDRDETILVRPCLAGHL
ncbi:MAG: adenylosuccinate synthase [Deltaproteobacteria bacterium]|nr:adenylosuccinate synthase [Deltaproteobacteria bacterium]